VRSPIGLKLGEDLGLISQISVHVLVSRFVCFYIVNKQKNEKTPKSRKSRFYKTCVFSAVLSLIDLRLGGDIWTSTRNGVVCLFCLYYCLFHFVNINKENTLYGFLSRLSIKCFEIWWMSLPIPNSQFCRASFLNSSFVYVLWI
jgi:hypothetical protein